MFAASCAQPNLELFATRACQRLSPQQAHYEASTVQKEFLERTLVALEPE